MYSEILSQLQTQHQVDQLHSLVRQLRQKQYSTKEVPGVPDNIRSALEASQDKAAWLEGLEHALESLPQVSVTLAIRPSESITGKLSAWVKQNLNPETVLELNFDPSVLGGAQIASGGKYGDYTVRHGLDQVLKQWQSSKTS